MGRKDSDGEFIRDTCKLKLAGAGGDMACVTASGKVLDWSVSNPDLKKVLEAWNKLPESERKPGAVQIGERGVIDSRGALPTPPPGTLIIKVFRRALARETGGELRLATPKDFMGDAEVRAQMRALHPKTFSREYGGIPLNQDPSPDHIRLLQSTIANRIKEAHPETMWLTEAEWKSLIPANPKKGDQFPIPDAITKRIFLFHLEPNRFFGDPDPHPIRSGELKLTVEDVSSSSVRLRLDGIALLGADFETAQKTGRQGFDVRLLGYLNYDLQKKGFTRFDIAAIGDACGLLSPGLGHFVYSRPGRAPFGIAFELVQGDLPADRLPPRGYGATSNLQGYFGAGK